MAEKTGHLPAKNGPDRYAAIERLYWSVSGLSPMVGRLSFFASHAASPDDIGFVRLKAEVVRLLTVLERHLATVPDLAGTAYLIADIAACPWIAFAFEQLAPLVAMCAADMPAVDRWYEHVGRRPAVVRGLDVPCADRAGAGTPCALVRTDPSRSRQRAHPAK